MHVNATLLCRLPSSSLPPRYPKHTHRHSHTHRHTKTYLTNTKKIPKKKQMIPGALSLFVNSLTVLCIPIINTSPVRKRKSPKRMDVCVCMCVYV